MQKPSKKQLAKGAYSWLRFSPLLTVITYIFLSALNFGAAICRSYVCIYNFDFYINAIIGILGSALWHLILLQYVNNKESEFVHWHGLQAALLAGIRTATPIGILFLDYVTGANGNLYVWTILVLIALWSQNTSWGNKQVEIGECNLAKWMGKTVTPPLNVIAAESDQTTLQNPDPSSLEIPSEDTPPFSNQSLHMDGSMTKNDSRKPADVLKDILDGLRSADTVNRFKAIMQLREVNYSSEAIRNELEKLALNDDNQDLRKDALAVLELPAQRFVRSQMNKLVMGSRLILLNEINEWEKLGLLDKDKTSVLRKRYDFDAAPTPDAPQPFDQTHDRPAPVQPAVPTPKQTPVSAAPAVQTAAPIPIAPSQPKPVTQPVPARPRATLLETLLSETSIKIALYLGAFFVIASAAILAALSPAARLPVLIIATVIFGGLSLAIRKRLPQPSFAIFIVFSFLLPITANVVKESIHLSTTFSALYWVFISLFMAFIWGGSTWLYESRVFSITSFIAFSIALYRIGDVFEAGWEFYTATTGLAALAGLIGVWALKKWKDAKFSLPLFFAAQLLQVIILGASLILFFSQFINTSTTPLWNNASIFTWGFAFLFYVFSDILFPFLFFPWLAALTLLPLPWFPGIAFEMESRGQTLLFFAWGMILSIASEVTRRLGSTRKFSLPVLLVSIPTFGLAVLVGFIDNVTLGFVIALGITCIYATLHLLNTRGWLWALALFNFIIAYFAFFNLPFLEKVDIFFGYQLLGLSLLFLLPDLFLKNDFKADLKWRLPQRIYGAGFTVINILLYIAAGREPLINTAIIFGIYALFFTFYALRYNTAQIGYMSTASLAISALYTFNHFNLDIWHEALSILSVLYFFGGYMLKKNEVRAAWRTMLEASGLILGSIISLIALFIFKENSGWLVAVTGLLFIVQMYSRRQGLFEIGAHILLSIAACLILFDFNINESTYILIGLSLVILGLDLAFSHTYHHPRLMGWPAKVTGAVIAFIASLALVGESNLLRISVSFAIYTAFFLIYILVHRKALYGYIPATYLPLTVFFALEYLKIDAWLPALTGLAVLYFIVGLIIRRRESQTGLAVSWSEMMRLSGLTLGAIISISAMMVEKEYSGYFIALIAALFAVEMFIRKNGWLEAGVQILAGISALMLLQELNVTEVSYYFLAIGSTWLVLNMIFAKTFTSPRPLAPIVWGLSGIFAVANIVLLFTLGSHQPAQAALCFGIYTLLFLINTAVYQNPLLGYMPAAYFALTILYALESYKLDLWLPILTALSILYFAFGLLFSQKKKWGEMLRNSALILGSIIFLGALFVLKEFSGWYMAVTAILFVTEMFIRKESLFEAGAQLFFSTAIVMILRDFKVTDFAYIALAVSLLWLGLDATLYKTYPAPRLLAWPMRGLGGALALGNAGYLLFKGIDEPRVAMVCFGLYSLFFLVYCLLYQQPVLGYSVTISFIFTLLYSLRAYGWNEWFLPITAVTAIYYGAGQLLQKDETNHSEKNKVTWSFVLWTSGLGIGLLTSFIAPIRGGISAAIPSAVTATMVSVEALKRRNAWLGFPANALYLMSYFILLMELNVDEPQFFSMGAALLGMIQHYLLTRTESKTGAFIMGMLSQLTLLGTTYIQMVNTEQLVYFVVLFFQSMIVLFYGLVIRSRSLTFTPIVLVVLGVITVLYTALKGLNTVVLIGCTGIILLMLGILAVMMRERIVKIGERLSDWKA